MAIERANLFDQAAEIFEVTFAGGDFLVHNDAIKTFLWGFGKESFGNRAVFLASKPQPVNQALDVKLGLFDALENLDFLRPGSFLNQFEKAEPMSLRSLELRRSILGEEHFLTINSMCILARIYVQQRQFDKAGPLTDEVLRLGQRLPIENGLFLTWSVSNLGWSYLAQGHVAEAGTLCELAVQAARRKPDGNPLATAGTIIQLGAVRLAQERYAEAEMLLREGSPFVEKYWADEAYRPYVMSLLGESLAGQKKFADAEPLLLQGCQGLQQRQASLPSYLNATRRITESLERLVQLYDAWGKPVPAAEWKQKLAAFQQTTKSAETKGP